MATMTDLKDRVLLMGEAVDHHRVQGEVAAVGGRGRPRLMV